MEPTLKALRDLAKLEEIEDNVIIGVKSGTKGGMKNDYRGKYVESITMKRKKKKTEFKGMDSGFAGPNKIEAIAEEEDEDDERDWCL